MAGDWIKMRVDLCDDPSVVMIAAAIGADEDAVVGKLHRLWSWADKHTTDGMAPAISAKWVDRYVGSPGFAQAMVDAEWLLFTERGVIFPSFDRHNGQSAKTRAEAAIRQRLSRKNRDEGETGVTRTPIPRPFVRHVFSRDSYKCVFCGEQSDEKTEGSRKAKLSVDHLVPQSRGGSTAVENLACCCRPCNNEKNDRTPEEWGLLPTFLQPGVSYLTGRGMSQEKCDAPVTREEESREEKREPASQVVVALPTKRAPIVRGTKRCPDSFRVTDDLLEWAAKEAPDVALDRETANLRDHEFAKAHTDWPATWRKWMRKAQADAEVHKQRNTGETAWQRSQRERVDQFSGGLASRKVAGPQPIQGDVFDVITTERLG